MPTFFPTLVVLSLVATVISLAGLFIVKRITNPQHLRKHHALIDSILGVVGTLFSILLGLLVAGAMDRYQIITTEVSSEARSLAEIYVLADGFPDPLRTDLQTHCRKYCDLIINQEWPAMERGELVEEARHECSKIALTIVHIKPTTEGENNLHSALLSAVEELGKGRRDRAEALKAGIHSTAATIFVSSFIILVLTFLYVTRGIVLHTIMTIFVATCLALNIGLLHLLTSPFKAELRIKPTGFILNQTIFNDMDKRKEADKQK